MLAIFSGHWSIVSPINIPLPPTSINDLGPRAVKSVKGHVFGLKINSDKALIQKWKVNVVVPVLAIVAARYKAENM